LKQAIKTNGLPFSLARDPFYCLTNQNALAQSIAQMQAGQKIRKIMAELESMENEV
jgi:hypothetical protein